MRFAVPRLTFLWRFTLVTLGLSLLSASVLAATIEYGHRSALEHDAETSALGRLSAQLTGPLDSLAATGHITKDTLAAFERTGADAQLFEYVTAMRIYRADGQAVFPSNAPRAQQDVHAALASDNFLSVDRGDQLTTYSPYYTRNEQVYVIAVDFAKGQLDAADNRGRIQIFGVVGAVSFISFVSLLALAAGASRELERRRREAQSTFVQTLTIMADVIDLRDPYTAGHSKRVATYSRRLAVAIALPDRQTDVIESGALLHDIGKIGIPDAVLFKPAQLDTDERRVISTHPVIGARLLGGISAMADIVPCVLHHHEKLDGTGYPDGLAGETIPIGARIIAVADTFDAMTTDRPYRRALSVETALREMVRVAGTQLDERLVMAFAELVVRGEIVPPPSLADIEYARAQQVVAPYAPAALPTG
jgi:HD-GYP domain-containing protein (c-di-GMP phosphodiesterase class II)